MKYDISGEKFGKLIVVKRHSGGKNSSWLCHCECGNECIVPRPNLRSARTRSCGCTCSPPKGEYDKIILERFNRSFIKRKNGCWEWQGALNGDSYGTISFRGKTIRASRFSFEKFKRKLMGSEYACHTCDNPLCVNPDHLYAGDPRSNIHDSIKRKRFNTKGKTDLQKKAINLFLKNKWSKASIAKVLKINRGAVKFYENC